MSGTVSRPVLPATATRETAVGFSPAQARALVADLFVPNPWIYWSDMLLSLGLGGVCFYLVRQVEWFSPLQVSLFIASSLLFYRVAMFIHEIVHFKSGVMRWFNVGWNLLVGVPFLIPSFVYETHLDHHRSATYGTRDDGEYLPFARRGPWLIALYLAQVLVVPLLAVVRFTLLAPLAWAVPPLGRWVHRHFSSMVIDPRYLRPAPSPQRLRLIRVQEALVLLWCVGVGLGAAFWGGWPYPVLVQAYLTAVCLLTLNALRTLGAHAWRNDDGPMSFAEQLLDSVNYPHRPWFTELWGPVGLRYHALHHLFPSMPYHNLGKAHRRLMAHLPADSPYRQTVRASLTGVIAELVGQSLRVKAHPAAPRSCTPD